MARPYRSAEGATASWEIWNLLSHPDYSKRIGVYACILMCILMFPIPICVCILSSFHPQNRHLSPNNPRLLFLFVDCATVNTSGVIWSDQIDLIWRFDPIRSDPIRSYLILSYLILSYLILSYLILSYLISWRSLGDDISPGWHTMPVLCHPDEIASIANFYNSRWPFNISVRHKSM